MNFLIDANLPPRLAGWLQARGNHATHVADLHALRAADKFLWQQAKAGNQTLVTKDTDFYARSLLLGQPPKVLLIAVGNCGNDDLLALLDSSWPVIEREFAQGARLVAVHPTRLEIIT